MEKISVDRELLGTGFKTEIGDEPDFMAHLGVRSKIGCPCEVVTIINLR